MTTSPIERAADTFAAELAQRRVERGMTKKQLAARMGFDPSYICHVESRRHRPTEDFARRAEAVLGAGGAIWQRFQQYDELRRIRVGPPPHRDPPVPEHWLPPGTGLIVEQEEASLDYVDGAYRCVVRRALYNAGTEPVTRYLIRVAVDRYPHDPERSNRHHRRHPLSFSELDLRAYCDDGDTREPMDWRKKHDRDAFKEVWLLFENAHGRFPLYPGDRVTIEYSYTVGQEKWGQWFQRAIRLPTRQMTVRLDFPLSLNPQVWGVETSLSSEEAPLRTPLARRDADGRAVFEWFTEAPPLNARYRFEWRFRGQPDRGQSDRGASSASTPAGGARASERMRAAGIVQRGDDLLRQPARPFDLPRDEGAALDTVARLRDTLARLEELHLFSKGVGLAAPQIGLPLAAALIRPPDRTVEPLVLLNPRIVDASGETDEKYEGCLSFFDVRGLVARPLRIDVEHARWDGGRVITSFEQAMARLVAHEVDHLEGRIYADRMAPGEPLIPVEEYRDTGHPWRY
ncbi:peptide deformylase [Micromonospora pattaloongensis]|uniref:Peptide deformylase n=1 Tax=Micromonospora pattaloongensis TaxID=405436 RepID=A0A1H3HK20_9ACTN|nr:peptide deformylase [Micromonospora pattaloongensis]SDY15831.1 peptide deformylase [Micromonospora pattaloongensis]